MKRKLTKILAATLLLSSMAGVTPAMAASSPVLPETAATVSVDGTVTPFADQYETYYRTVNGVFQYRIWNITQGYWLNDWTNC